MPLPFAVNAGVKLLGVDITSQIKNTLAGTLGISGNRLKSPDALIRERQVKADSLLAQVYAGNRKSWEQLWLASGRQLPIRALAGSVVNGSAGWPRVKPYLNNLLQEIESRFGPSGVPPIIPDSFQIPNLPGLPFADTLAPMVPAEVKDAAKKVADAVGTTTSTVGWIALAIGAVLVVKALRK